MYNFKPFTSNTNHFIKFLILIHLTCTFTNLIQHTFKKFGYTFDPLTNETTQFNHLVYHLFMKHHHIRTLQTMIAWLSNIYFRLAKNQSNYIITLKIQY